MNNSKESFEYYRFLLTPIEEAELPFHGKKDRKEIISEIFSPKKTYKFNNRGTDYGLRIELKADNYVYASIGKKVKKNIRTSPEEGFTKKEIEDWPGCDLFINLSDEHDTGKTKTHGQLIIMQVNDTDMRYRTTLLQKLASVINKEIQPYGFFLSINPILSENASFWSVVSKNKGKIKKITFSYTPPNLLNLNSSLEDDLREISSDFNSTKVQISLENSDGNLELSENNDLLKESAEYVDQGGGTFKLSCKGNHTISSEDNIKTKTFMDVDITLRAQHLTIPELNRIMQKLLGD